VDLEFGAEVFLGAGDALLAFGGGLGLFHAFHALLDQRAEVLGLGGDKGGETVGEDGCEGEHEGGEPVGDRGVGVAEAEDDGELGADDKGVADGVGLDDGFEHTGADREDDGNKEEGEGGEEHKELGTPHGGCSRVRVFPMAGAVALEEEALPRLPEELWPLIFRFLPAEMLVEKVAGIAPAAFKAVEHTAVARMRIRKEWGKWELSVVQKLRHLRVVEIDDLTLDTALCCLAWGNLVEKIVIDGKDHSNWLWSFDGNYQQALEFQKIEHTMRLVQADAKMIVVKNWMREVNISEWIRIGQQKNNVAVSWRPNPPRKYWLSRNGDIIEKPFIVNLPMFQRTIGSYIPVDEKKRIRKELHREQRRRQIKNRKRICKRGKR